MPSDPPRLTGVIETALYVADLARSVAFYRDVFDLRVMVEDARFAALDVAGRSVLLLFRRGATLEDAHLPGGTIPAHDGSGRLHFAFAASKESLPAWEARLGARGVAIVSAVDWPRGGRSLYFHDPDGHVGEIASPGIWESY